MFELMAEYSERYLYEFFQSLEQSQRESIGLMGGWAAFLLLARDPGSIWGLDEDTHRGRRESDYLSAVYICEI